MDKTDRQALKVVGIVALAVTGLSLLIVVTVARSERAACQSFCADFGETAYYSAYYGCYCVTADGKRYNPEMTTKAEE